MDPRDYNSDIELERLQKAYDCLEAEEPPALLDQAVLNTARREVERSQPRKRSLRWFGAWASAAVVVLAMTLVLQQNREYPATPEPRDKRTDTPAPAAAPFPAAEMKDQRTEVGAMKSRVRKAEGAEQEEYHLDAARPATAPASSRQQGRSLDADDEVRSDQPMLESMQELDLNQAEPNLKQEPEQWLERIILLKRSGQIAQFEQELAEFQQTYPEYPLPEEFTE